MQLKQPTIKAPYLRYPVYNIPSNNIIDSSINKLMEQKISERIYQQQQIATNNRTPKVLFDPLLNTNVREYYRQKYEQTPGSEIAGRYIGGAEGAALGAGMAASIAGAALFLVGIFDPLPIEETVGASLIATGAGTAASNIITNAAVIGGGIGAIGGMIGSDYSTFHATKDLFSNLWKPGQPVGQSILNSMYFVGQSMDMTNIGYLIKSSLYSLINNDELSEVIARSYGMSKEGRVDMDFSLIRESLNIDLGGIGNFIFDMTGEIITDPGQLANIGKAFTGLSDTKSLFKKVGSSKFSTAYVNSIKDTVDKMGIAYDSNKYMSKSFIKAIAENRVADVALQTGVDDIETVTKFVNSVNADAAKKTVVRLRRVFEAYDNYDDTITGYLWRIGNPAIAGIHGAKKLGPKINGVLPQAFKDFLFGNNAKHEKLLTKPFSKTQAKQIYNREYKNYINFISNLDVSADIKKRYKSFEEFYEATKVDVDAKKLWDTYIADNKKIVDKYETKIKKITDKMDLFKDKKEITAKDIIEYNKLETELKKLVTDNNYLNAYRKLNQYTNPEKHILIKNSLNTLYELNQKVKDGGKLNAAEEKLLDDTLLKIINEYLKNKDGTLFTDFLDGLGISLRKMIKDSNIIETDKILKEFFGNKVIEYNGLAIMFDEVFKQEYIISSYEKFKKINTPKAEEAVKKINAELKKDKIRNLNFIRAKDKKLINKYYNMLIDIYRDTPEFDYDPLTNGVGFDKSVYDSFINFRKNIMNIHDKFNYITGREYIKDSSMLTINIPVLNNTKKVDIAKLVEEYKLVLEELYDGKPDEALRKAKQHELIELLKGEGDLSDADIKNVEAYFYALNNAIDSFNTETVTIARTYRTLFRTLPKCINKIRQILDELIDVLDSKDEYEHLVHKKNVAKKSLKKHFLAVDKKYRIAKLKELGKIRDELKDIYENIFKNNVSEYSSISNTVLHTFDSFLHALDNFSSSYVEGMDEIYIDGIYRYLDNMNKLPKLIRISQKEQLSAAIRNIPNTTSIDDILSKIKKNKNNIVSELYNTATNGVEISDKDKDEIFNQIQEYLDKGGVSNSYNAYINRIDKDYLDKKTRKYISLTTTELIFNENINKLDNIKNGYDFFSELLEKQDADISRFVEYNLYNSSTILDNLINSITTEGLGNYYNISSKDLPNFYKFIKHLYGSVYIASIHSPDVYKYFYEQLLNFVNDIDFVKKQDDITKLVDLIYELKNVNHVYTIAHSLDLDVVYKDGKVLLKNEKSVFYNLINDIINSKNFDTYDIERTKSHIRNLIKDIDYLSLDIDDQKLYKIIVNNETLQAVSFKNLREQFKDLYGNNSVGYGAFLRKKVVLDKNGKRISSFKSTNIKDNTFVIFDTETTGSDDELYSLYAKRVKYNPETKTWEEIDHIQIKASTKLFKTYTIAPEVDKLNGGHRSTIKRWFRLQGVKANSKEEIVEHLKKYLDEDDILVAHNAEFDISTLVGEVGAEGSIDFNYNVLDTQTLVSSYAISKSSKLSNKDIGSLSKAIYFIKDDDPIPPNDKACLRIVHNLDGTIDETFRPKGGDEFGELHIAKNDVELTNAWFTDMLNTFSDKMNMTLTDFSNPDGAYNRILLDNYTNNFLDETFSIYSYSSVRYVDDNNNPLTKTIYEKEQEISDIINKYEDKHKISEDDNMKILELRYEISNLQKISIHSSTYIDEVSYKDLIYRIINNLKDEYLSDSVGNLLYNLKDDLINIIDNKNTKYINIIYTFLKLEEFITDEKELDSNGLLIKAGISSKVLEDLNILVDGFNKFYNSTTDQTDILTNLINGTPIGYLQKNKVYVNNLLAINFLTSESVQNLIKFLNGDVDNSTLSEEVKMFSKILKKNNSSAFSNLRAVTKEINKIQASMLAYNDLMQELIKMGKPYYDVVDQVLRKLSNGESSKEILSFLSKRAINYGEDIDTLVYIYNTISPDPDKFSQLTSGKISDIYVMLKNELTSILKSEHYNGIESSIAKFTEEEGEVLQLGYETSAKVNSVSMDISELVDQAIEDIRGPLRDVKSENKMLRMNKLGVGDYNRIARQPGLDLNGKPTFIKPGEDVRLNSENVFVGNYKYKSSMGLKRAINTICEPFFSKSDKDTFKNIPLVMAENSRLVDLFDFIAKRIGLNDAKTLTNILINDNYYQTFLEKNLFKEELWNALVNGGFLLEKFGLDSRTFTELAAMIESIGVSNLGYIGDPKGMQNFLKNVVLSFININTDIYINELKPTISNDILDKLLNGFIDYKDFGLTDEEYNKLLDYISLDYLNGAKEFLGDRINKIYIRDFGIKVSKELRLEDLPDNVKFFSNRFEETINNSLDLMSDVRKLFIGANGSINTDEFYSYLKSHPEYYLAYIGNDHVIRRLDIENKDLLRTVLSDDNGAYIIMSKDTYIGVTNKLQPQKITNPVAKFIKNTIMLPMKLLSLVNLPFIIQNAIAAGFQNTISRGSGINMPGTIKRIITNWKNYNMYKQVREGILKTKVIKNFLGYNVYNFDNSWLELLSSPDFLKALSESADDADFYKYITKIINNPEKMEMLKNLNVYTNTTSAYGEINEIANQAVKDIKLEEDSKEALKQYKEMNIGFDIEEKHTTRQFNKFLENSNLSDADKKKAKELHNVYSLRKYNNMSTDSLTKELSELKEIDEPTKYELRQINRIEQILNNRSRDVNLAFNNFLINRLFKGYFDFNNDLETVVRLSAIEQYIEEGMTLDQATAEVINRQFLYSNKSQAEQMAEFIIPFVSYPIRMASLVESMTFDSNTMDLLFLYDKYTWKDEHSERSDYLTRRRARGDVPIGNKLVSLTSPFNEGIMNVQNPLYSLNNKLNPMAKPIVDAVVGSKYNRWNQLPVISQANSVYNIIKDKNVLSSITNDYYKYSQFSNFYLPRVNNRIGGSFYNKLYTRNGYSRIKMNMQPLNSSNLKYRVNSIIKYSGK